MASTYLSRTFAQAGNRRTFTISYWIKMGIVSTGADQAIMGAAQDGSNSDDLYIHTGRLNFSGYYGGTAYQVRTTAKYRDLSGWYHHVIRFDSTQSTASDRLRLYVNGELQTALDSNTYPSQNLETTYFNTARQHTIGSIAYGTPNLPFNGSMSHFHFCDGYSYGADSFGQYDANGVWKIKTSPSVTYGTNGFFILKDGNGVTDQSGNSNNWTVAGGTLTNTEDNPSNVFATVNPLDKDLTGTLATYSYGNNRFSSSGNSTSNNGTRCTLGASSGKYYWEVKNVQNALLLGIQDADALTRFTSSWTWGLTGTYAVKHDGEKSINGTQTSSAVPTFTNGDILMLAMDLDNSKLYFGKNGTWSNSGDPTSGATGTGSIGDLVSGTTYIPVVSNSNWSQNTIADFNFGNGYFGTTAVASAGTNASGNGIFEYDVPTGYTALSTKGLNL
jgi:hypothetical protein